MRQRLRQYHNPPLRAAIQHMGDAKALTTSLSIYQRVENNERKDPNHPLCGELLKIIHIKLAIGDRTRLEYFKFKNQSEFIDESHPMEKRLRRSRDHRSRRIDCKSLQRSARRH